MKYCIQFIVAIFVFVPLSVFGGTLAIPGLFNTGVDDGGVNLPLGSNDPHWVLSSAPGFGPVAYVQNPRPVSWIANTPVSQWIGPAPGGNTNYTAGIYVYDLAFDLTGLNETTAVVQGSWASDDGSQIFLNGVNTGISHAATGGPFGALDNFTLNSGFVPGINTLSFRVTNNSGSSFPFPMGTPTGLHVTQLSGQAQMIPEPTNLLLGALGIVVVSLRRRFIES